MLNRTFIHVLIIACLMVPACATFNTMDQKTDAIIAQYDATKAMYIYIRQYVVANKKELNIPDSLWKKFIEVDDQLKKLDIMMNEIKTIKKITKAQINAIKNTAAAMSAATNAAMPAK